MASRMSTKQYEAYNAAVLDKDTEKAERIFNMGYQTDYTDFDIEAEIVPKHELDEDEVMSDLAAGMDDGELKDKYGISTQKLSAIKRKAK